MKYAIFSLGLIIMMSACTKEAATSTATLNEQVDTVTNKVVLKDSGSFMSGPYGTTMGVAKLYLVDSVHQLSLERFSVSNGPDLKVYLSKEMQPINFVKLGSLKSTNGNQVYLIPNNIKVTDYPYALIHCEQYNHLFGYALLRK